MTTSLLPPPITSRYFDTSGLPLAGGLVYTYLSGTSTPALTFSDAGGTAQNANPVVLDSTGSHPMYLTPLTAYRFVVKDAAGVTLTTADGIYGCAPGNSATVGRLLDPTGTIPYSSLPYVPVQQGGGTNQGTNKLYIGWTPSASRLQLQVDGIDYGSTWPIGISGNAATATTASSVATANLATQVQYSSKRTDSVAFPVLWGAGPAGDPTGGTATQIYSCAAVTINSNTGTLGATSVSGTDTLSAPHVKVTGSTPLLDLADMATNSNVPFSSTGYQKLPGGLILMWGDHTSTVDNETITFPGGGFPNACLNVMLTVVGTNASSNVNPQVSALTQTTFAMHGQANERHQLWTAIGY